MQARTSRIPRTILALGAALIVTAMTAHALIPHEHQHFAFGEGIAAAAHGEERKVWFSDFLLGLALVAGVGFAAAGPCFGTPRCRSVAAAPGVDPLLRAFRRGILHPKICG